MDSLPILPVFDNSAPLYDIGQLFERELKKE